MAHHVIEYVAECKTCGGTGIYVGMAERDGIGVICYKCNGTGKVSCKVEYDNAEIAFEFADAMIAASLQDRMKRLEKEVDEAVSQFVATTAEKGTCEITERRVTGNVTQYKSGCGNYWHITIDPFCRHCGKRVVVKGE